MIYLFLVYSVKLELTQSIQAMLLDELLYEITKLFKLSHRITMTFQSSIPTDTTKHGLMHLSLKLISQSERRVTVFTHTHQGLFSIGFPLESTTIKNLISLALEKLQTEYELKLGSQDDYELFAAKKNGKKYSDLPALEPSQDILLTKFKCYFLKKRKYPSQQRTVLKSQMMGQTSHKKEVSQKQSRYGCISTFCPFSSLFSA